MATLSVKARAELANKLTQLWDEDVSLFGMPERALAGEAMTIIKQMQDISAASQWLEGLLSLTPETYPQFEKKFKTEQGNGNSLLHQVQVNQFLSLARWISGSVGDHYNPYESFSLLTDEQIKKNISLIKNKIQQSSHLISSYDPALQARLFKAVNDDDFDVLESILKEYPFCTLDIKNKEGFNLLSLAYQRRTYFNTPLIAENPNGTDLSSSHSKNELINPEEKRSEEDRQKANKKILLLLLEKANINDKLYLEPPPVSEDELKKNEKPKKSPFDPTGKTLLHFAAHAETPPSELLFYLLIGADRDAQDHNGKTPLEYLKKSPDEEGNARLNKSILEIGVPELFDPKHAPLLDEILQNAKEEENSLFNEIEKFEILADKFGTVARAGHFFYRLMTDNKLNTFREKYGDWIVSAGDEIAKTNKSDASLYYKKAAEFGNPEAMKKLGMYYHFDAEPRNLMEAIEWYEKSYSSNKHDSKYDIHHKLLTSIATNLNATPDEKNAAILVLKEIYASRWNEKSPSVQSLFEKIEFYSLIKNNAGFHEEEKPLLDQIKASWKKTIDRAPQKEKAELLYLLLSHDCIDEEPDLRDAIDRLGSIAITMIQGSSFPNHTSNDIDNSIRYLTKTASLDHLESVWTLADVHSSKLMEYRDDKKALELFAKYAQSNTSENYTHNSIPKIKVIHKNTDNLETKKMAINTLIDIYELRWKDKSPRQTLNEKIQFLIYLEENSAEKEQLNKLNKEIVDNIFHSDLNDNQKGFLLFNLLSNEALEKIAARTKTLIEEMDLANEKTISTTNEIKFTKRTSQLLGLIENKLVLGHQYQDASKYHQIAEKFDASDENDILKLLNQHEKLRDEKADNTLMDQWIANYGNAETFTKIDQTRKQLISHRLIDSTLSPMEKNPFAIELERKLIEKWKNEGSSASTNLLKKYYTKKLDFLKAIDDKVEIKKVQTELSKLNSIYRLFSNVRNRYTAPSVTPDNLKKKKSQ